MIRFIGSQIIMSLVVIFIAIQGMLVVACFFWAYEGVPGEYLKRSIGNPKVEAGDRLRVHAEVYWNKSCTSVVNRSFIPEADNIVRSFESEQRINKMGLATINVSLRIPYRAPVGPAVYRVVQEFYCNPWQRLVAPLRYEHPDMLFEILPPTGKPHHWEEGLLWRQNVTPNSDGGFRR